MTQPNDHLWQEVLTHLQTQMTPATFDTWVRSTRLLDLDQDRAVIAAASPAAKEWLENRLNAVISRAVEGVLGRPVELEFVLDSPAPAPASHAPPPPSEPEVEAAAPDSPGAQIAQADYYTTHFAPGGSGYSMLSHYDTVFWMPYLDAAWPLWLRLANEKRTTVKQIEDRWTEPQRYSYRELANWLNLSHQRYVSGYIWECHQSRECIRGTGQALDECCRRFFPFAVRLDRDRRPRCVHWKTGLLETLHAEHLVAIEESKAPGQKVRAHLLKIQTWRLLPVLTPAQVAGLNPDLQKLHARWIADFGHLLGLHSVAHWEQIVESSLVPLMAGYQEHRGLDGPYRPNSHFVGLLKRDRPPGFEARRAPAAIKEVA